MTPPSRLNPANLLTLLRIVIIPVVAVLLYTGPGDGITHDESLLAFAFFAIAGVTDLADGFVARRYGMVTNLGKLLDPLADKLLTCTALIMLIPAGRVSAWMAVIVTAREIGVTALRGVATTEGVVIAASPLGKAKTLLLNIGLGMLILHYPTFGIDVHRTGIYVLGAGLVLTAWSGGDYFFRFIWESFKKEGSGS
jgi:CDP-diacylglycerol--glycerol-3-phosphate 3-phosphatidyltransferase